MVEETRGLQQGAGGRRPGTRQQLVEVGILLMLILPGAVLSLLSIRGETVSFSLLAWSTILRDIPLVAMIVYFLWQNGEPLASIGWRRHGLGQELLLGLALYPLTLLMIGAVLLVLRAGGLEAVPRPLPAALYPAGGGELALAVVLVLVVAVAEETIFRGYLLLRLGAITGRQWAAVLLSTLIFAAGHGYEGAVGVIVVGALGVWLCLIYLWRRNLAAPAVIHFVQNFLGLVVVPMLGLTQ